MDVLEAENLALAEEVAQGLSGPRKSLSSRLFYDECGSRLYEEICSLPEYYPIAAERSIMSRYIGVIAERVGRRGAIIELGSGSTEKIRFLLDHLREPAAYVPVDISASYLVGQAEELRRDYEGLKVIPVAADYTRRFDLPTLDSCCRRRLVYYPGSSIGNFSRRRARMLLALIAEIAGETGAAVIGVDRKKDRSMLEAAYNDSRGVTARFNLNILAHLNRRLRADFDLSGWRHYAFYNEARGRIEMHLLCSAYQEVSIPGCRLRFAPGDDILTEYSYKYTIGEFAALAREFMSVEEIWSDEEDRYTVYYLTGRRRFMPYEIVRKNKESASVKKLG